MGFIQFYRAHVGRGRRGFKSLLAVAIIGELLQAAPAAQAAIPDRTLRAESYVEMGMPSYDRKWIGKDFLVAAQVLQTVAQRDAGELPRYGSLKSGPMFDRIVSPQNLTFLTDKSLTLSDRTASGFYAVTGLTQILKTYLAAVEAKKVGAGNVVELMGAELRYCNVLGQLNEEVRLSIPANDPNRAARLEGLKRARAGMAVAVSGVLEMLTVTDCSAASRARLAQVCLETLPSIIPRLTTASQTEMLLRLDTLIDAPQVEAFRPTIVQLRASVRRATASRSA